MKIVRNNKVFVQNKDLFKTMQGSITYKVGIPNEVVGKVFTDDFKVDMDQMDKFVTFEEADSVEFFQKMAFLVDYDEMRKLSERELIAKINETMAVISGICANFNKAGMKRTLSDYNQVLTTINLLEHKFYDLRTILWEKQNHCYINKPYELSDAHKLREAFERRKAKKGNSY